MDNALPLGRRPAPLGLRICVWTAGLLVVGGLVLLWVHHVRPVWLRGIEVGAAKVPATPSPAPEHRAPTTTAPRRTGPVRVDLSGSDSATVTVSSSQYTVLVTVQGLRCWVQATTPDSPTPVFANVLTTGAQQTFQPSKGQLTLDLGASGVTVSVTLAGKHTPSWQFTPQGAPFTLDFTSSSS
jgi:hypothetical protein